MLRRFRKDRAIFSQNKRTHHMEKTPKWCVQLFVFDFVGACIARPRATDGRPYTGFKKPYAARIICSPLRWQGLFTLCANAAVARQGAQGEAQRLASARRSAAIILRLDVFANGAWELFAESLRLEDIREQIWYENESVIDDFFANLGKIYETPWFIKIFMLI